MVTIVVKVNLQNTGTFMSMHRDDVLLSVEGAEHFKTTCTLEYVGMILLDPTSVFVAFLKGLSEIQKKNHGTGL